MSPIEALDFAIGNGFAASTLRPRGDVGKIIMLMKPEVREALSRLTSDDALNVRPVWLDVPWRGPARRSRRWDKF